MGGAHRATAIGFVSAFRRLPVHPANTKANNRAMILIRAIPFCQVSKQERCPRKQESARSRLIVWVHPDEERRGLEPITRNVLVEKQDKSAAVLDLKLGP